MTALESWSAQHLAAEDSVVIEVTTNTWAVVDVLERYAGQVVVANPYKTKLIAQAHSTNDNVDALAPARLLATNSISQVWVPRPPTRLWWHLTRHRGRPPQQCTQAKSRVQHLLQGHNLRCREREMCSAKGRAWLAQQLLPDVDSGIVRHLLAQLDSRESQIRDAEQQTAHLAHPGPREAQLMQITGVGMYTAFSIVAIIGDVQGFPTASRLAGYAGLVPREHLSGQRAYHGHITEAGDRLLRRLMVEAAQSAVRWDACWRAVHVWIARRRRYSAAVVAVAHELLVTI
ncbi:MAG: IS110 family transposase, partial [Anaerolineae bacterium]|nr:IS110 family transposase [Anaerolineae bacterium]